MASKRPPIDSRQTLDFTGLGCLLAGIVFAIGFATMIVASRKLQAIPVRTLAWPILLALCLGTQIRFLIYVWDRRIAKPWNDAIRARDRRRARRIRWIAGFAVLTGLTELCYGFEIIAHHDAAMVLRTAWLLLGIGFIVMHATTTMRAATRPEGEESVRIARELRIDGLCLGLTLAALCIFMTPATIYRFVWWHHDDLVALCAGERPEAFHGWPREKPMYADYLEGVRGKAAFEWTEWSVLTLFYAPGGLTLSEGSDRSLPTPLYGPWYYVVAD